MIYLSIFAIIWSKKPFLKLLEVFFITFDYYLK